ncbi:MAG: protein kinase [Gemmatimonadaceae bacterium]|nr:protein kinase [Gemmatimonadaceae bacterium]
MIGERIGHLRVIASIGVGGMGAVWHAVDELLDRHVALKVIRPELMSRPGLAERFRSEAIVLARLQHPCIAALYGLEKRGDEFVMVMEFVDGDTLDNRLAANGALPWPEATRITRAVLDALDHAHESGVIHRDIKPANVMITRAGRVKVMDFGIARLVGAQRQTRTGAAVGTPSYMSPEQLLGQEVDGRADVYAVGTLLYELTTGHLPFEVEGDYLRMIAQLQQIPSAPSSHDATLPAGLDLIVARALQKEPDDRYATSGEFRDALEELEREYGVLRPYGTPASGSASVPGASSNTRSGAPSVLPAGSQPSLPFAANPSAVLTPVESAMSVTPVPFAVDPAGATPIDMDVPASVVASASQPESSLPPLPPMPTGEPAFGVASPTPEYVVALPAPVSATTRRAMPRAMLAVAAIAAVAAVGVFLTRSVTAREKEAGAVGPEPMVIATAPAPTTDSASVVSTPAAPPSTGTMAPPPEVSAVTALVDSAALKKALADSMRAVRKATRDSIRAARDSAAATTSPFALPGAAGGPSTAEISAATAAGRRAAEECVAVLGAPDMARIETLFGGVGKQNVVRIKKDGKLEVTGPLRPVVETDAADRATTRFTAVLQWKNGDNEDRSASASLRAIVERSGTTWTTRRCLIDSDGGARY